MQKTKDVYNTIADKVGAIMKSRITKSRKKKGRHFYVAEKFICGS